MPRWVKAIKSQHPRCRVCHHAHLPSAAHVGSEEDWAPPANDEEANQRAAELFVREFGLVTGDQKIRGFINSAERRIKLESPDMSLPERLKLIAAGMRAAGLKGREG